jgi:hypothetical protein
MYFQVDSVTIVFLFGIISKYAEGGVFVSYEINIIIEKNQ